MFNARNAVDRGRASVDAEGRVSGTSAIGDGVSALPRPDLPPGPHRDLFDALHDLHHHAGWPSLRALARETGVSHTTVSHAFSSPRIPTWGTLELLVEAMHGDTTGFHDLWLSATTPHHDTPPTPRIAGRRPELTVVRRHLETGTGLLLVTGEAGIGKTTLVQEAVRCSDTFTASGQCLPLSAEVPFMPVADAVGSVHTHDEAWFAHALARCPAYVGGSLAALLPGLQHRAPSRAAAPEEQSRHHLLESVAAVLEELRRRRPLALLLEDLHWADASTMDLVERLATRLPGLPLVLTWRTNDPATSPGHGEWLMRLRRLRGIDECHLGPLDPEETVAQLELLGLRDPERARDVQRRSGGHPLFSAHLAAVTDHDLPPFLAALLDRRLDGLGEGAEAVVAVLGVADRGLPLPVVRAASGLDAAHLPSALRELGSRHLLAVGDPDEVRLGHPLLAESARRRLVGGEAELLHARLAAALESSTDAAAAEVALHWRAAGDTGAERLWRVRAAREAHARFAARLEVEHWRRALDLWADAGTRVDGVTRTRAELCLVAALEDAGSEDVALRHAVAMIEREDLTPDERFEVVFSAAGDSWSQDGPAAALALLDELAPASADDPARRVQVLALRANLLAADGRHADAVQASMTTVELARDAGQPRSLARALSCHVWHVGVSGDLPAALRAADECRAHLDEAWGPGPVIGLAMMVTDVLLIHARPADEVLDAAAAALELIRVHETHDIQSHLVRSNVAEALLHGGRVGQARGLLGAVESGTGTYSAWPLKVMAAWASAKEGDPDRAEDLLDTPYQQDDLAELLLCNIAGDTLLWAGRPASVLRRTVPRLERVLASPQARFGGRSLALVARAAADRGVDAPRWHARLVGLRAQALLDPLGPGPVPGERSACTALWSAELARLEGTGTPDGWLRAADGFDGLLRPHDAAYCRWRGAQVALGEGQATLARRLLTRAAADAQEHVPLHRAIAATVSGGR